MAYTVTVRHVDTCLSCYLQDHHNREGECLIGIHVDRSSRVHTVKRDLLDAMNNVDSTFPEDMTDAEIKAAVVEAFQGAHPLKTWDNSLEPRSEDDAGEMVQAWFLFQWEHVETFLPEEDDDATTLAQDGVSSPDAPVVALDGETAPTGRSAEIRAKLAPALLDAYRFHRQSSLTRAKMLDETNGYGLAKAALVLARTDLEYNTPRYPVSEHPDFSAWGKRNEKVRYIPDVNAIGLCYVGFSHDIISLDHNGWYTSENGDNGEIVAGQVFQLPGRGGRPVFLAGHDDPNNDNAATIDFGTLYYGENGEDCDDAKRDAARAGDEMARIYGEEESEHGRHWQAGARFVDLGEEHKEARKDSLEALRELRSDHGRFVSARHLILSVYLQKREVVREEQAKLEAAHGGAPGFMEHINV